MYVCRGAVQKNLTFLEDLTDHAGPRRDRCECHPGTNFWHPPIEVTQVWHTKTGFGTLFFKAEKDYIDQEAGEKYETKVVGNGSSNCFVSYWWIYFCLVFQKRKRVPKTLLVCQNCVTTTGGCQNLVPGWHSQRRGQAWSVILCPLRKCKFLWRGEKCRHFMKRNYIRIHKEKNLKSVLIISLKALANMFAKNGIFFGRLP